MTAPRGWEVVRLATDPASLAHAVLGLYIGLVESKRIEIRREPGEIGFLRQPRAQRRLHIGHQQRGANPLA